MNTVTSLPTATALMSPPPARVPRVSPQLSTYARTVRMDVSQWLPEALAAAGQRLRSAEAGAASVQERQIREQVRALLDRHHAAWSRQLSRAVQDAVDAELAPAPAAPAPRTLADSLSLSLLDEDGIDEEIAVSRVVQIAEAQAEGALRDLAGLCARLRGRDDATPEANPMRPAVVAGALLRAVQGFGLARPLRLALLRELGSAVGEALPPVYARQLEMLAAWGIEPARFVLKLTFAERAVPSNLSAAPPAAQPPSLEPPRRAAAALPQALAAGLPGEEAQGAADTMARLLALLTERVALSPATRGLLRRLDAPARRIAEADPQLWSSLDHPLWQLLDRLVAAGTVDEELDGSLEAAVQRLEASPAPDAAHVRDTLHEVDFAITDLLGEQAGHVEPQADALQAQMAERALEAGVREQIVQQLRAAAVAPALRQFLLGPWTAVLARTAGRHGAASIEMKAQADLVDRLVAAGARPAGETLAPERLARWVERARRGLAGAGFAAPRIEAELADLEAALRDPVPAAAAVVDFEIGGADAENAEEEVVLFVPTRPDTRRAALNLHGGLPTVPIEMVEPEADAPPSPAALDTGAWLEGLQPGAYCRMFLLGRWMNTQLLWRGRNGAMFVFKSRHGGRTHSLSRRALEKLRAAGLAATIEQGHWVAEAMAELAGQALPH